VLKSHMIQCLMTNVSQKEQVYLDLVNDEEASCDAL
jgi:hypothetical protein